MCAFSISVCVCVYWCVRVFVLLLFFFLHFAEDYSAVVCVFNACMMYICCSVLYDVSHLFS